MLIVQGDNVGPYQPVSTTSYVGSTDGGSDAEACWREEEDSVTWRMPSSLSLSDFTIEIIDASNGTSKFYDVHKVALAIGQRACKYFKTVFHTLDGGKENEESIYENPQKSAKGSGGDPRICRIPLNSDACDLFPIFLDYLYYKDIQIDSDNAVGLCYLAKTFGQSTLQKQARAFVRDDLCFGNIATYYLDSVTFDRPDIYGLVAQQFADEIFAAATTSSSSDGKTGRRYSELFKLILPDFFMLVLSLNSPRGTEMGQSGWKQLSSIILEYCKLHRGNLTKEMFQKLTASEFFPYVNVPMAMQLLGIELAIADRSALDDNNGHPRNGVSVKEAVDDCHGLRISDLQRRCIDVLTDNWKDFCSLKDHDASIFILQRLPSAALTQLMFSSLSRANTNLVEVKDHLDETQFRESKLKSDYVQALKQRNDAQGQTELIGKSFEATKNELKVQLQGLIRLNEASVAEFEEQRRDWEEERKEWEEERLSFQEQRRQWQKERTELKASLRSVKKDLKTLEKNVEDGVFDTSLF